MPSAHLQQQTADACHTDASQTGTDYNIYHSVEYGLFIHLLTKTSTATVGSKVYTMCRQDCLLKELIAALSMMPACTQGDDYVDWVGMSLYHFGTTYPYDQNVLPEAQKFTSTVSLLLTCWHHALHALLGISVHTLSCCCCLCLTSQHRSCLTQWNDSDLTACCACSASK